MARASWLSALLRPVTVDRFFDVHWGREPLLVSRTVPDLYRGLPTSRDVEFLVSSLTTPQAGWFSLVKDVARRPADSFLSPSGMLNLSEVNGAFRQGYSLLLNQVQKRHRATGELCRTLELELTARGVSLARHIGANGYLSPPRSQGFSIHYDPQDVFILQLAGSKYWRLYGGGPSFPTKPPLQPVSPEVAGAPIREFVLSRGDFLYIPRGILHDASAADTASLHLTLSLEAVTWRDVLGEILDTDPSFGQSLPVGFLGTRATPRQRRRALAGMATALARSPAADAAFSTATGRLLADLDPLPHGTLRGIERAASLSARSRLGFADGTLTRLERTRDCVVLHLPGTSFKLDRRMEPVLRYMIEHATFRAADLPMQAPLDQRLGFLRDLAAAGCLVRRSRAPVRASSSRP